jgi:peptidoglycan biosynthesis protein MviN/MurJ (putative lipid II flippase)
VGVVVWNWPGGRGWPAWASAAGVAATSGLALMAMLLGHAYLTASKMTMRPFRRINGWLIGALVVRIGCAAGVTMWMQWHWPVMRLWPIHGFMVMTRWGVGLAVPLVFVVMAHECIGRRATQSATGILYVAGVLIFIGELLGLHLARETGLPF